MWYAELQPKWGPQDLKGKQGGTLFIEEFLKHSKLDLKYFPLALKSKITRSVDRICSPSKQQIGKDEDELCLHGQI